MIGSKDVTSFVEKLRAEDPRTQKTILNMLGRSISTIDQQPGQPDDRPAIDEPAVGETYEEEMVSCCFCGTKIRDRDSNNPDPASTIPGARCCGWCDYNIVIPARLAVSEIIRDALDELDELADEEEETLPS